jgi:hypothetical protein
MGAYSFSGTAASNTTVDGIGAAGSDSPDNIDNLVRALAASDANLVRDLGGANTVAGTADAITVALADASTPTYFDGMRFSFRVGTDSTSTTPTLNVDSLGAKTIKKTIAGVESALVAGDLQAGMTAEVVYRSAWASAAGAFELLNPYTMANVQVNGAGGTALQVYSGSDPVTIGRYSADANGANITFIKSRNATLGSHTVVQSGDVLAGLYVFGSDGSANRTAAQLRFEVDGTPGASDMPGRIVFATTADGAASSTERLAIKSDGTWNIAGAAGSNGQVIKQASGATAWGGVSTFATVQASTSGTDIDFNSIPSWVREIDILFDEVSFSGTDNFLVQIGDSGGVETSGYTSTSVVVDTSATQGGSASASGYYVHIGSASGTFTGKMSLVNITGNAWISSHVGKITSAFVVMGGGTKTLSATLDRVRVTRTGSNTFDAGQINICYR